jgi:hypothetical protein
VDPPFVDWSSLLPAFTTAYDSGSENDCAIERLATSEALAIKLATAFPPLSGGSASRDSYCAAHHGA